ncbi:Small-conductance mechanosensitive channel (modular protein) [Candidatus Desulfosporosinus infrequens]|uniref:Small-conductance mechanosensitive channel (Modular protein) n=1 Tax=Candidatus Desulfosporosinus infrequens TaxID=2043169 RepID=A0A2U3KV51_9FIRM|nr:Small-conductance mechanosensitive channel (modular protein) [Candidatus Desulfosporosinus infrequens]
METSEFKRVMWGYDRETVDSAWAEMKHQLSESNAVNNELRLQINSLRGQHSEFDAMNKELCIQINGLREQNAETTAANKELNIHIDSLREQNAETNTANKELYIQIDSLREHNSESNAANNELRLQINSLREHNSESSATNNELRLQIDGLRVKNSECENRLKYYEQIERDMSDALLSAQRIANQVKEEATKQADDLLQSARSESETLLNETTRISKLKVNDAETLFIHKKSQIILIEEQIQVLSEQETDLQKRIDQVTDFLEMARGLLGVPKISNEQDSE